MQSGMNRSAPALMSFKEFSPPEKKTFEPLRRRVVKTYINRGLNLSVEELLASSNVGNITLYL